MNGTTPPVTVDYPTWVAMFPEFSGLSSAQGNAYFMQATLICANSATNPINGDGNLAALLYMLTSHFAWLNAPRDTNGNPTQAGQNAPQLGGPIRKATRGSGSVQTERAGSQ